MRLWGLYSSKPLLTHGASSGSGAPTPAVFLLCQLSKENSRPQQSIGFQFDGRVGLGVSAWPAISNTSARSESERAVTLKFRQVRTSGMRRT